MTKKPKNKVRLVRRDKFGRFIKASRNGSRSKGSKFKALVALPKKGVKPPARKPVALPKKSAKPSVKVAPLPRKKKVSKPPVKVVPLPRKKKGAKAPVKDAQLPRKKKGAKPTGKAAPPPRKKKGVKAPVKAAPLPRKKKGAKAPVKAAPLPRKKKGTKPPAKAAPLPRKKKGAKPPVKAAPLPRKKKRAKPPTKAAPLPRKKRKPAKAHPPRKRKHRYPSFMASAVKAETMIQEKLVTMGVLIRLTEPGIRIPVKTFINADSTVDGELRISELPDEWRTIEGLPGIIAALSEAIRGAGAFPAKPEIGGAFWISFGLRFGPKNMDEIMEMAKEYKRFRGLLQVGAHHTTAQSLAAMLNNALALRMFIDRVWAKRSLPPIQLLVRFVWTPTKTNPGRFSGEEGSTK